MKTLFLRELTDQLKSIRVTMSLVIVLVLMLINGFVYIERYQEDVEDHAELMRSFQVKIDQDLPLPDLMNYGIQSMKKPLPVMFVSEGGQRSVPNSVGIRAQTPWVPNYPHSSLLRTNYGLPSSDPIDWEFIVKVLLSLMALILVYDSVCGEKEGGTLRLVFSNHIARPKVVMAKFLANWTILVASLAIGCVLSLTIITSSNRIPISGGNWTKLTLFLVLSIVYLSLFVLIGMAVSASVGRAATSLVICLLIWIAVTVAVPGLARLVGQKLYPIPTPAEVESQTDVLLDWENRRKQYEEHNARWRWPWEEARKDNFSMEKRALEIDERIDSAVRKLHSDYLRREFNQRRFIGMLSSISPAFLFQSAGRAILGTGFLRNRSFAEQVEDFRPVVRDFFIKEDAKDPESPHLFSPINYWYLSRRSVDPSLIPRFSERPVSSAVRLRYSLVRIAILTTEVLLTFLWLLIAFIRYDVR